MFNRTERLAITADAIRTAQRARIVNEPDEYTFTDLRADEWTTDPRQIASLQASFDLYPAGTSAARRIDDMIARNLLTYMDEAATLLELNAPHLFHAEVINGPAPVEIVTSDVAAKFPAAGVTIHPKQPDEISATERERLDAFEAMIESHTDDLRADLLNTIGIDLDEATAREIVLLANERGLFERDALTAYALGYLDGQDDDLDPEPDDTAAAHELHGGAAGSFASEGCPLCPPDEPAHPYDEAPNDREWTQQAAYDAADYVRACQKKAARRPTPDDFRYQAHRSDRA